MEVLVLLPIGFVGMVIWVVSAEASSMAFGAEGYHPLLVGALAAAGQTAMLCLLYFGGRKLVDRWSWLERRVTRFRKRFEKSVQRAYLPTSFVAAILGVPPLVAMVTLADGFGVRFRHIIPIAFVGRVVRFTALAASGPAIVAWWNSLTGCGG